MMLTHNGPCILGEYVDEKGHLINRSPVEYPYSHDGYVVFDARKDKKHIENQVWSDRLRQWDSGY